MSTSANVTHYWVKNKFGVGVAEYSQHAYCKNSITDNLKKHQPPEDFMLQARHPDENECDNYSKEVNLKDYLDGKYKHTFWREEDGNLMDIQYCAEHHYQSLKEDCVESLKRNLEKSKTEVKGANLAQFKQDLKESVCPFCKQKMKYYDGALGYEAMQCTDCGFTIDHMGFGFDEKIN